MSGITFTDAEKEVMVSKVKRYFEDELNQDIGQFDAEFLIDFFSEELGVYFYNRGLYDAKALLEEKMDSITEAFYEIEKPTDFNK